MIGRKITLSLANMLIGSVLGLVVVKLVSLYFTPNDVGHVQYALGVLGLLYFMTDLGMGQAHVKRVSEGRDPGDCFATFAVFKVVATALFVFVSLAGLFVYTIVLGKPLEDTSLLVLFIVLVYYVAKSLQDIGQSSFDARLETARSQFATLMDTLVRVVLTLIGAIFVAALVDQAGPLLGRLDPTNPFFAWVAAHPDAVLGAATAAGAVAAAITGLVMLRRSLERGRFRMELLRDYWSFALPLFLTSAIGIISTNIDSVTLGFFLSDADVGVFGQIKRLPLVLGGISVAVGALLFPSISAMAARDDRAGIFASMDRAARYLSMLLVPMTIFTGLFATRLIHVFLSDRYLAGALPLAIMTVYVLLVTMANPHAQLLLGIGRPDVAAKLSAASAITLIVGNLLLVPNDIKSLHLPLGGLGILGTAIATLIAGLVFYVGLRIATHRLVGYRERSDLLRHLVAAAVMGAGLVAMDRWAFPLTRGYDILLYGAVGATLYVLGLVAMRGFGWEDWRFARESLHPGDMVRYVRDEIKRKRR